MSKVIYLELLDRCKGYNIIQSFWFDTLIENGAHWDRGHKESESTDDNITYHI